MTAIERDKKSGAVLLADEKAWNSAKKSRDARRNRREEALVNQKKQTTLEIRLSNLELRIMDLEKKLREINEI